MAFNGSGTFLINTAGQPVVSGTVISSTAFNALTADLATGLSTAITKDGQTTVTANIPMSTYKFTGLGVGSAATDSANLSQVQSTVTKLLNSVSGADTITATASPTLAAYAAGQMFYFVAAGDNTTSVTLNIDALGAKAVTRDGSTALVAADIKSGEVIVVVYDGTRFQVVSQLNSAGNATFANVSITSALNVGGVVTLSGGTANGVLYLNGSKVATSGTALTFDGTNLGVSGSVKIPQGYALEGRNQANSGTGVWFGVAGRVDFGIGGDYAIIGSTTGTIWGNPATNSELMRLTSTGLGIGTSSPARKLDIYDATAPTFALHNSTSGTGSSDGFLMFTLGSDVTLVNYESGYMAFSTSATERMRLDSSGQLGLGVTPSAWGTGKVLEIGALGNALWGGASYTSLSQNAYYDGANYKYARSTSAARFDVELNAFKWYNAASGTAGNTISFTTAMTLDASGNLGVGTTSPGCRLHAKGSGELARLETTDATGSNYLTFRDASAIKFYFGYTSGGTENFEISNVENGAITFATNNTERARITAGGKFLVGTTSNAFDGNLLVYQATATNDTISIWNAATSGDNQFIEFYTEGDGTGRGSIDYNRAGGLVRYNTTSDYRAKDILGPVQNSGATIDALKVYEGVMKGATQSRPMLIAHEAQEYAPYAVSGVKDEVKEDGTPKYQQMDVSALVPLLLAEVQSLRKRVAELEAK